MESTLKFQRGDIYFVRLDSSTGSEQNGTRPAVILQNDVGNTHSPTLIVATVIKGESAFPKDTLAEMIAAQEKKHTELDTLCEEASAELERNAELMANVSQLYEELISYADLYDSASFEAKKMIVSQLIRRVEVYRGYQIHVDFNFDLAQYLENSDELAC